MNNLILTIFVIAASIITSLQNNCKEFPNFEQQCICAHDKSCSSKSPIQWSNSHIVNADNGEVDVILENVKLCAKNEYMVKLKINEKISAGNECNNTTYSPLFQTHSAIELVKCSHCKNISNKATIKFNYVFTGCYIVTIIKDDRFIIFKSAPKFISTNFPKELNATSFELIFNSVPTRNETKIELQFNSVNMTKRSINTNVIKKKCREKNCMPLESITEITFDHSLAYQETFTRCTEFQDIEWNCSYHRDSQNFLYYSCFYYDLKPGSYYFTVSLIDEYTRCNEDSIWALKNSCSGYFPFDVAPYTTQQESYPIEHQESQTFVYLILFILLFLIFLILLLYYIFKKLWLIQDLSRILPPNEILLIYARDAPVFSQTIQKLKNILLSTNDTVEVYDIMDEENFFLDMESTINNAMINNRTKIILFLNKCSHILKDTGYPTEYIKPKYQDSIFNYAIQQLERRTPQNLENIYIIGIEKQHIHGFKNLKTKRSYLMPDETLKLLKKVFGKNIKFDKLMLKDFENKCRGYQQLNRYQPDYYKDILQRIKFK